MNKLLQHTLTAHGGLQNWHHVNKVNVRAKLGGTLWDMKQQSGFLSDSYITIDTRQQLVTYQSAADDWTIRFEPGLVAAHLDNALLEALPSPRHSFANHTKETAWTRLQTGYFAGYAIWNYINIPFIFSEPDFEIQEMEPWIEDNEEWQRLQVKFPSYLATHCPIQTFYIDKYGFIRRHDYEVAIIGNASSAHYLYDYQEVRGIKIPTKRRVFARLPDNSSRQPVPILVSIDLNEIHLS